MSINITRVAILTLLLLIPQVPALSQITITATAANNGPTNYSTLKAGFDAVVLQNNYENGFPKSLTVISPALVEVAGNVELRY